MFKKALRRTALLAIAALLLVAVPTALARPAGGGKASTTSYPGTLTATPNLLHAGDTFDVHGCGYSTSMGNVIVGFAGGGWGSPLDENGCFTITGIPALSGDSMPAGTYEVVAKQFNGRKWVETGDTSVTVVD
jgi:hypothetical protein